MSIQPEGEKLRKAMRWISSERQEHPDQALTPLVDQACLIFNLTPLEAESLTRMLIRGGEPSDPASAA